MRTIRAILLSLALVAPWGTASFTADMTPLRKTLLNAEKPHAKERGPLPGECDPSSLYLVAGVILFIWSGIALFLFMLDRKVSKLEGEIKSIDRSREGGQ